MESHMGQVYILVNDGTRYLIVRKRIYWTWRKGRRVQGKHFVNQAGQWALPGGRPDCRCGKAVPRDARHRKGYECPCNRPQVESPEGTAVREFKEESGIDLTAYETTYTSYQPQ